MTPLERVAGTLAGRVRGGVSRRDGSGNAPTPQPQRNLTTPSIGTSTEHRQAPSAFRGGRANLPAHVTVTAPAAKSSTPMVKTRRSTPTDDLLRDIDMPWDAISGPTPPKENQR